MGYIPQILSSKGVLFMSDDRMLYMAYGMNMNREAMSNRCPAARCLGGFYLPGHRLVMRGVADFRPDADTVLPVALWEITRDCLAALDRLEGYPTLYDRRYINCNWIVYDMNGNKNILREPSRQYYEMIKEAWFGYVALKECCV
jgi:gamma-glutamylcyclotransferase (GGCT)/AIG2-like uncharacterized protein YtfP